MNNLFLFIYLARVVVRWTPTAIYILKDIILFNNICYAIYMKWYFASRTRHKDIIKSVGKLLEKYNHNIIFNWTSLDKLIPYDKNEDLCKDISQKISSSIKDSDIFVLISDPEGTDMFIELGIAISSFAKNKSPKIYVVGEYNKRSLMHFHPSIIHMNSLKEVLTKEIPNLNIEKINLNI